jgi:hypothetical protein
MKITKHCIVCDTKFHVYKSEAERGPCNYCSQKCMGLDRRGKPILGQADSNTLSRKMKKVFTDPSILLKQSINSRKYWLRLQLKDPDLYRERVHSISTASLGRKRSVKECKRISKSLKSKYASGTRKINPSHTSYGKRSFYKPLRIWMRSSWEVKFASWLHRYGIKFMYEWKRLVCKHCTYLPDFYLPDHKLYVEIKGRFSDKAVKIIKRIYKEYPTKTFCILNFRSLKNLGVL